MSLAGRAASLSREADTIKKAKIGKEPLPFYYFTGGAYLELIQYKAAGAVTAID